MLCKKCISALGVWFEEIPQGIDSSPYWLKKFLEQWEEEGTFLNDLQREGVGKVEVTTFLLKDFLTAFHWDRYYNNTPTFSTNN